MAARNTTQPSAVLSSTTRWGWLFSRMGRAVRAAEKRYAADQADSRRRLDQRLAETLGSGARTWGPAELERKRDEVNLMADLMTTLKDPVAAAQEEPAVQTEATHGSSGTGGQKVSAGSSPAPEARSNVGVIDQDSPGPAEETESPAGKRFRPRHLLIYMVVIAAPLLSLFWAYTGYQPTSAPDDAPDYSSRPYERVPISSTVLDSSATQRRDLEGAYATALKIQNAESQGASEMWCVLADPASKDCTTTMRRSFQTHESTRDMVHHVTTSVGKMNHDRTSVEILLQLNAERHAFPLEWVDGRWQADPVTIPAAKEKGGLYTTFVADSRYNLCADLQSHLSPATSSRCRAAR
jgi:hypothetical protein